MHISEGVLSAPVLLTGAGLTAVGTAVGLQKMEYDDIPKMATLSSVFFVASLIHVPLGPSSVHLLLNGICGLLLGWLAFPSILVGLALQAVLFQFGGLTVLGVNTLNVAFPAVVMGWIGRQWLQSEHRAGRMLSVFVCGSMSVLFTAMGVAVSLTATGHEFWKAAMVVLAAHLPIALIEGIITVMCLEFLRKVKPELLPLSGATKAKSAAGIGGLTGVC